MRAGLAMAKGRDREKRSEQGAHARPPLVHRGCGSAEGLHQAEADGVVRMELERLRLMAEHRFQAVTDYQLRTLDGPPEEIHYWCASLTGRNFDCPRLRVADLPRRWAQAPPAAWTSGLGGCFLVVLGAHQKSPPIHPSGRFDIARRHAA